MKVSATFNEQGLALHLTAETNSEQCMIGAVLNQPQRDCEISHQLLRAETTSDGHFTNRKVRTLKLTVMRDESAGDQ